jgi:hypothetical protein
MTHLYPDKEDTMNPYRTIVVIALAVLSTLIVDTALAQGWHPGDFGSVRFRLGYQQPDGGGSYWEDKALTWTGASSDLDGMVWGIDGRFMITPTIGFQTGWEYSSSSVDQSYLDWVDGDGRDITHRTRQTLNEVNGLFVYRPLTRSPLRPFIGAGAGWLFWDIQESGRFIDFADPQDPQIFSTTYSATGSTLSALAIAGVDIRVSRGASFFVEGRYRWANADLGGAFSGLGFGTDFDGYQISGGFSFDF